MPGQYQRKVCGICYVGNRVISTKAICRASGNFCVDYFGCYPSAKSTETVPLLRVKNTISDHRRDHSVLKTVKIMDDEACKWKWWNVVNFFHQWAMQTKEHGSSHILEFIPAKCYLGNKNKLNFILIYYNMCFASKYWFYITSKVIMLDFWSPV